MWIKRMLSIINAYYLLVLFNFFICWIMNKIQTSYCSTNKTTHGKYETTTWMSKSGWVRVRQLKIIYIWIVHNLNSLTNVTKKCNWSQHYGENLLFWIMCIRWLTTEPQRKKRSQIIVDSILLNTHWTQTWLAAMFMHTAFLSPSSPLLMQIMTTKGLCFQQTGYLSMFKCKNLGSSKTRILSLVWNPDLQGGNSPGCPQFIHHEFSSH